MSESYPSKYVLPKGTLNSNLGNVDSVNLQIITAYKKTVSNCVKIGNIGSNGNIGDVGVTGFNSSIIGNNGHTGYFGNGHTGPVGHTNPVGHIGHTGHPGKGINSLIVGSTGIIGPSYIINFISTVNVTDNVDMSNPFNVYFDTSISNSINITSKKLSSGLWLLTVTYDMNIVSGFPPYIITNKIMDGNNNVFGESSSVSTNFPPIDSGLADNNNAYRITCNGICKINDYTDIYVYIYPIALFSDFEAIISKLTFRACSVFD